MKILFTVFGNPKAQKRHRTGKGYNYDPSESDKADFLAMAIEHKPDHPANNTGILMNLAFFMPRPKYHFNSKGEVKDRYKYIGHLKTPDCDNLAKMVIDALAGIYYRDDSLITSLHIEKVYSYQPRTEVAITYAEGGVK